MKYDDASWHSDGEFPADLPREAAATHIGFFLAWQVLNGHASSELLDDFEDEVAALRERRTTGAQLVLAMDGKLTDDDLDDEGNAFAVAYYVGGDGAADDGEDAPDGDADDDVDEDEIGLYLEDYIDTLSPDDGPGDDVYRVADTWENYDRIVQMIDGRYDQWVRAGRPTVLGVTD